MSANDGLTEMIMRIGKKAHDAKLIHPDSQVQRRPKNNVSDCEVEVESLCRYFMAYREQLHTCLIWAWADIVSKMIGDEEPNEGYAMRVIEIEDALGDFDVPAYARPNLESELGKRAIAYVVGVRTRRAKRLGQ